MSSRTTRLALLANELAEVSSGLVEAASSHAALIFLDRLARCEAFLPSEQNAARVNDLIGAASKAREQDHRALADWAAAGLNLEGLRQRAEAIVEGANDVAAFGWDCLLVAAILPWLDNEVVSRAESALEHASASVYAHPVPFASLALVAEDRLQHERPERMANPVVANLLEVFAQVRDLADLDCDSSTNSSASFDALLAVLPVASRTLADTPLLSSETEVIGLFSRAHKAVTEKGARLLAAASQRTLDHVLLHRMREGEFLLVRDVDSLRLQWYGSGNPRLVHSGQELPFTPVDGGIAWLLPHDAIRLDAQMGPNRIALFLPESGSDPSQAGLPAAVDEAREWAAFAPRTVERRLRSMKNDPRITSLLTREIDGQIESILGRSSRPSGKYVCAFPVVPAREITNWLGGGVLHAVVPELPGFHEAASIPMGKAFPEQQRLVKAMERDGVSLRVEPNPEYASIELEGDSFAAAALVALEAAKRGVLVPDDVVVSASIEQTPEGTLRLRAVAHCDRKRRLLEIERPGCRFFFVASLGQTIGPSSLIQLCPLAEGSIQELFARILPPGSLAPEPSEELARLASVNYQEQRYELAREKYEHLVSSTNPLIRFVATLRLGGVALHQGRTADASRLFKAADDSLPDEASNLDVVELRTSIARGFIDSFKPVEASAILVPLLTEWVQELKPTREPPERRMALVSILGSMRTLRLLEGRASDAVVLQQQLLAWAPVTERARGFADLAECLRRAKRSEEARTSIAQALDSLRDVHSLAYRQGTEAFIRFFESRLALEGFGVIPIGRAQELIAQMPETAAAHWRLASILLADALRRGDQASVQRWLPDPVAATGLRGWCRAVELLRLDRAGLAGPEMRGLALTILSKLRPIVAGHKELAHAVERLEASAANAQIDVEAEDVVLADAAY